MTAPTQDDHAEAMKLADKGFARRSEGDHVGALECFSKAFELERKAASKVPADTQPGHAVLHRSAAALALDANRVDEARRLVEVGLDGHPEKGLRAELEHLLGFVDRTRRLGRLAPDLALEFQRVLDVLSAIWPEAVVEDATTGQLYARASDVDVYSGEEFIVYSEADGFRKWKDLSNQLISPRVVLFSDEPDDHTQDRRLLIDVYGDIGEETSEELKTFIEDAGAFHGDCIQTEKAA